MKVVDLDPDCKPQVGSLTRRLEDVIMDYVGQGNKVTYAEVIGVLEIIKNRFYDRESLTLS